MAEACANTVLSLPLYPQMTTSHVEQVASSICRGADALVRVGPPGPTYSKR
jgi:hypothetical protein